MIRALIDTNVILDFIKVREFHEEAGRVLEAGFAHAFTACIATHQVTTISYYMEKAAPSREDFRATLASMLRPLDVFAVSRNHLDHALGSALTDFEDAVLEDVAAENGMDYIVTRNIKDFRHSRVAALTPAAFLKLLAKETARTGPADAVREPAPSYHARPRRRRKAAT